QRLAEVARTDALEVEPGDQLLDTLGLAQVGRQDRRGELLALLGRPAVVDAGLLHRDRAHAGGDGPLGQVAVADDLAASGGIAAVLVAVDPVGDLGLDGLGEQLLGALAEEVGEDVLGLGQWHDPRFGGSIDHGGVLLCRVGTLVDLRYTRVRRLFSSRYPQHSIIPPSSVGKHSSTISRSIEPSFSTWTMSYSLVLAENPEGNALSRKADTTAIRHLWSLR